MPYSAEIRRLEKRITRLATVGAAVLGLFGVGMSVSFYVYAADLADRRHNRCVNDVEENNGDRRMWTALLGRFPADDPIVVLIQEVVDEELPLLDDGAEC